jgi:hypothetical protein
MYKIREYQCDLCDKVFEEMVQEPVPETLPCKHCPHGKGVKVLSATPGKVVWGSVDSY